MANKPYSKPSDEELRKRLSAIQYEVTQHEATEPPFHNAYWNHHSPGLYVDVVTGEPLFSSLDKFESGTGWPSFSRPLEAEAVRTRRDGSHGMLRTEVRSQQGGSHLGHLFDDGPGPAHARYCINSAALRFVPLAELQAAGYGAYLPLFEQGAGHEARPEETRDASEQQESCATSFEVAVLAGGCFWGMQEILRTVPGVLETQVGYAGGNTDAPTYQHVKTGATGHAEAVRIVFDPRVLSFEQLLERWFFKMHDPTTKNRQGNDIGTQYRSAIFAESEAQRQVAEQLEARLQSSGQFRSPLTTEITGRVTFTPAEEYHQQYLQKHPGGYTCHFMRD